MEHKEAMKIAEATVEILKPYCDIIHIAGSCRRGKPEVKDIDIVCLPKPKIWMNVFGEEVKSGRNKGFIQQVELLGEKEKGSIVDGKLVVIKLDEGIKLELNMPVAIDFYRLFAVKTGSGDYARNVIAAGWRKRGWCGSDAGLRRVSDCVETKPSQWKCIKKNGEVPPVWKSEQEFFDWIKVPWIEPVKRNI